MAINVKSLSSASYSITEKSVQLEEPLPTNVYVVEPRLKRILSRPLQYDLYVFPAYPPKLRLSTLTVIFYTSGPFSQLLQ